MTINTNLNAINFYSNRFDKNADEIAKDKDFTKNIVEENVNAKSVEIQTAPIKTEDEMFKSLLDIKV